ncbi:MAG: A/G-specific adenine glycosylase [Methanoregula sp.]|jgi:A/G-specific adenine glycosylase|uniref:A/G-specific adenine glycosylase n=1 Tax=Methanoregula sp. TaxID=2052170 RepID=UPI003C1FE6C0
MPGYKKKQDTVQETLILSAEQYVPAEMVRPSISEFQRTVLSYYERSGRHDMPWRHTTDPYHILVSEIMLQQTQVERVTLKYPEFIAAFPDFTALAGAPLANILRVWQGMGYNRRAIALQKCAIRVTGEYGGILPRDVDTLATFPGIGYATASSIAAFAFNLPVAFIETNIRRVFIHYFFRNKDPVRDDEILPLVDQALYRKNPRVWYWALMDLGASLKKSVPNPNRRSVHYTKQSAFEGSDRRLRGQVLKLLVSRGEMASAAIIRELGKDRDRVLKILAGLEEEGFIRKAGKKIMLVS